MAIVTIEEFSEGLTSGRPIAGLDLGTKTIGIAVSDRSYAFANPRPVLSRRKFTEDAVRLKAILDRDEVTAIVLGLPLNMDGSSGPRAQATRTFARLYGPIDDRPLLLWDERLSTVAAERNLLEMDMSRKKRATRIDSAAAAIILQGVLDRLAHLARPVGD
ncbi:Holliday junction resolvase RuvX [Fulvimarina sp. 2208YS6-2-32]|uniref:Putative pre-16S rRNA nuclease n=1 Tax=Fulvimarina uroteuthidis TaxID=3098149 RepID=A0ABU5I4R2_9HYPH|nr:Holliday junction resolvase RuvX [Fulvimarina sp. 2208YS6-2-32]MDY8109779.1 Holliday junction resolvase RuvX [Fulvimarina sp. 2208YS6-2-32]